MTEPSATVYAEARRRAGRRRASASTDWPELAPPVPLSSGELGAVQAADREIARQTAARARAVAAFAAARPAAGVDRVQGEPGAMSAERWAARSELLRGVSEWATPELAVALSRSQPAAERLLVESLTLVGRLPGTLAALEAGALHPGHLGCLLEHVAPIADDRVRAEVEAALLRWAAGRVISPAQLSAKARREVAQRDARAAARRLAAAVRERGVYLAPGPVAGMAAVTAVCTLPEAQALYRTLQALVDALDTDPDDARTRGQKLVDVLLDLVCRPGDGERPPVQVALTVVAAMGTLLGADTPGEVDGHVVPAEMIRHLLRILAGLPPTEPAPDAGPASASGPAENLPAERVDETVPGDAAPGDTVAGDTVPGDTVHAARVEETGPADTVPAARVDGAREAPTSSRDGRAARSAARRDLPITVDPDPEPVPEEVLLALWAAENPNLIDAGDLLRPEDLLDPAEWADLTAWFDDGSLDDPFTVVEPRGAADPASDASVAGRPPGEASEPKPPPGGTSGEGMSGWWASADRAVQDAGVALRRAGEALGHARRLVSTAGRADVADEIAWQHSTAGRVGRARTAVEQLAAAGEAQREALAELLAATDGGGLVDRPRLALTDALSGTLLAVTDLPQLRRIAQCGRPACRRRPERCGHDLTGRPGLGAPPPTDGYRPGAELDRFVRARDRRCRFPGCRRRVPRGGELDHNRPYPEGPTSAANLTGFCTTDHRGKHQALGWRYVLDPDGTLTVTTPTGLTTTTEPPPY